MERRLAAILVADVVGYSRLMGVDEEGTLSKLRAIRTDVDKRIERYGGQIFGSAGDSVIAEFTSPVEAVRCAVEIQQEVAKRNASEPQETQMLFRIGVNLGDVIAEEGNFHGDGVNIAARLESIAPSGGICISRPVAEQMAGKVDFQFADAGEIALKNIAMPVGVWVWPAELAKTVRRARKSRKLTALIAGLVAVSALVAVLVFDTFGEKDGAELPTGAKIAIIPFQSVGGDQEDAYFSEGLTRDLNALLSKFSNLFVIAPEAGESYRDDPKCETIRNELDADYILSGSVRRSQDKLRVTTDFIDAKTCRQLKSPGPFDKDLSLNDVLDVQIEIARTVAAQIGSTDATLFSTSAQQAIREKAPENLEAYECYLLSFWFYQTFGLEAHRKARDCLLRTVKVDPGYSLGWSRLAFNYLESKKRSHDTSPDWARLARDAAGRALQEDRNNPDAYYARAILSRMLGEDKSVFMNNAQKAIDLNPNDSWILADLGIFLAYSGEWEKGEQWITRARALNPKLHPGFGNAFVLHAYARGDYEEARDLMLSMSPANRPMGIASMTAIYAMNGEPQKADAWASKILEQFPEFLNDPRAPYRARGMPKDVIEDLMKGLTKAGLKVPETDTGN
ncbi:MAG: adenylate/guanylate cyclase domain-containing protein [Rhizobiaceae bacterium]